MLHLAFIPAPRRGEATLSPACLLSSNQSSPWVSFLILKDDTSFFFLHKTYPTFIESSTNSSAESPSKGIIRDVQAIIIVFKYI